MYLSFLAYLHKQGLGYSSVNTARSALSTIYGLNNNSNLGEHKLVVKFMKGIFKIKPPAPKYSMTWDCSLVLRLIQTWDCEKVSLKLLSYKLVALLALITSQRVQTFEKLLISNIRWTDPVQIKITNILKTTKICNPNPILVLPPYQCSNLCPVVTLRCYIDRTKCVRKNHDELLLSYNSPHKPVGSQTISRWLCKVLDKAGIDTGVFSGHSFRHASTSKAASQGVTTDVIFKNVGWSEKSGTFARYYKKPIVNSDIFANAVLNDVQL